MLRAIVGFLAVVVLSACQPADGTTAIPVPRPSGVGGTATDAVAAGATLRWAVRSPTAIVPQAAVDDTGLLVVDRVFDSLTRLDADGTVRPCASTSWETDDGRTWRFALRPDAMFHDGTPVTTSDFVRGWAATVRQGRTGAHLADVAGYRDVRDGRDDRLRGVRAIDDTTLEVTLRRPDVDFPAIVAHPSLAPLPAAVFDDTADFAAAPIGNGPYALVEPWVRGQFIRVARVEDWNNGPSEQSAQRVREIVFRITDADSAYVGFQQGRVDVSPIPAGALSQARRTYGVADRGGGVVEASLPTLYFLGIRVDAPPWDDPEVRRAVSRAIDRAAIVAAQSDRQVDAARWIVPPAMVGSARADCDACLHLPSLAAAALEQAGVTELTLTYDDGGGHEAIAEQVRADLAAIGVELTTRAVPADGYLDALEAGELGLFRFGWQAQGPHAGAMLAAVVEGGAPVERGDSANYTGYASDAVDALLSEARATADPLRRQQLWARAETVALADMPIIPLFSYRQRAVVSSRVERLTLTPWGTATPEQARIVAEPDVAP